MSDLKAIETTYKGYKFRSRTEARWAIFFDAIDIEWKYEHEGYKLGDEGLYLPDFWLPGAKAFAEVKGQEFTVREINLCRRLAVKSGYPVIMLTGGPEVQAYRVEMPDGVLSERAFFPKDQGKVADAVVQARSARFEHGETPENIGPRVQVAVRGRRGERTGRHTERGASAERELIRALLFKFSYAEQISEKLGTESFREPSYRAIYQGLLAAGEMWTLKDLAADAAATAEEILAEGAPQPDSGRTVNDSLATLRARNLDCRAAELDRLIPIAAQPEKDALIKEKDEIRKELNASGRNYYKKFRRSGQ